jgi:hypothetical protein
MQTFDMFFLLIKRGSSVFFSRRSLATESKNVIFSVPVNCSASFEGAEAALLIKPDKKNCLSLF